MIVSTNVYYVCEMQETSAVNNSFETIIISYLASCCLASDDGPLWRADSELINE